MNKVKLVAAVAIALVLTVTIGVGLAAAASDSTSTGLADKLAAKFNLDKNEVQQAIDQDHQEREARREDRYAQRLDDEVQAGRLTQEQKDKLLAKHQELKAQRSENRDAFRTMTPEARKTEKDKKKAELEQWAQDNGVPSEYLMPGAGGRGMGHGMMRGEEDPGGQL